MNLRGIVTSVGAIREVSTQYGSRELAELRVHPQVSRAPTREDEEWVDAAESVRVTLWGDWAETADLLDTGMEVAAYDLQADEFRGDVGYATAAESMVVVEPSFLVDVTDVRGWVQCPRIYYLNKLSGVPLAYPVTKGTIVHEVFGDLLRGRDLDETIDERVGEVGLELGLLGKEAEEVAEEVRDHASAIEGWLDQGTLSGEDDWRSEQLLVGPRYAIKGRADALRRGMPVELKTGKNTRREPRFPDKIQAAAYSLLLGEHESQTDEPAPGADTGILLYTKNAALERNEESGDLSPAKEFSIGSGLLKYVVRARNAIASAEVRGEVPTGYETDAKCEYCFEREPCMAVAGRLGQESKAGQVGKPLPETERTYFERCYKLIETERRAVHREYAKLWEQTAHERAEDDRALVDLEPAGQEQLDDGRWRLTARAPAGAVSKLRPGDVALASDGDPIDGDVGMVRIEQLGTTVEVVADEPLELRRLDIYPSEMSADRMLRALHDAVLQGDERRRDILLGRAKPEFDEIEGTFVANNAAQNEAVRKALAAEDCALVHGPPGTGKTYTIARIVEELRNRGDRVLVSAFTNRAVDNMLEAIREGSDGNADAETLRVGTETGVREDMLDIRLDRAGDPGERVVALEEAGIVAATAATCGSTVMGEQSFDVAVVDEATQLTEPESLAAINLADTFVLVGDHEQLPPVVRSEQADLDLPEWPGEGRVGKGGSGESRSGSVPGPEDLSTSLFERLVETYPDAAVMLDRQYRMAQRIQAFPSREFYDGALRPATGEVAGQRIGDLEGVDPDILPEHLRDGVAFVDPGGSQEGNANPAEAEVVAEIVESYIQAGVDPAGVGVIAPFRAQVAELASRLPEGVVVDTVDRFQGSSSEVIVVSFVATGDLEGPIFEDHRRVNVALTRAKKSLVLVGDEAALRSRPLYERMIEWASG